MAVTTTQPLETHAKELERDDGSSNFAAHVVHSNCQHLLCIAVASFPSSIAGRRLDSVCSTDSRVYHDVVNNNNTIKQQL